MTIHVVQYSGGIGSWATALRVAKRHGTDKLILLAADTKVEDPDLWRFVADSAAHLGVEPVIVTDGRTPWQVFADKQFLGNSRIAPCSVHLKQKPCRAWLTANADPADTILYVGIDWSEQRRVPAIEHGWTPWQVQFPMCDPPYLTKRQMLDWARAEGLRTPRLYDEAFSHNNCFGACVRAGQRQWRHLLEVAPERYLAAEAEEEKLRAQLGNVAILKERRRGVTYPLPLRELRRRTQAA
jgi:3'-phosphoadenosine 5'-phosphosulfate sulfotransferase (PAPS reductase)/FAD synthetase